MDGYHWTHIGKLGDTESIIKLPDANFWNFMIFSKFWRYFGRIFRISFKFQPKCPQNYEKSENFKIHVSDKSDESVNLTALG